MKCSKCGYENEDSNIFCEYCGKRLNNLETEHIPEEQAPQEASSKETEPDEAKIAENRTAPAGGQPHQKQSRKIVIIISACVLAAILVAGGLAGFLHYQKIGAINAGIKNGEAFLNERKYNEALSVFDGVLQIDANNADAIFGKAKAYSGLTDYQAAKTYFEEALSKEKDTEKLKLIFDAYIDSEVKNKATQETLFALLERATQQTGDAAYVNKKSEYTVKSPSFNLNSGTYQGKQSLEIIKGDSADKVYYTTDGSVPTTSSSEYTAAISLGLGEQTVKAIEVGASGYQSKVIEGKYTITEIPTSSGSTGTSGGSSDSGTSTADYQNFNLHASSTRADMGGISYYVDNVMDRNNDTAWVEGVSGDGIGEYIQCVYAGSHPITLHGFSIKTGYVKSAKSFAENGNPSGIQVYVNTSPIYYMSMSRTRDEQFFSIGPITINPGDSVVFVIDSVVPGPEDGEHDTAISELVVF